MKGNRRRWPRCLISLLCACSVPRCATLKPRLPTLPIQPLDDVRGPETVHAAVSTTFSRDNFEGLLNTMVGLARHLSDPGGCVIHVIHSKEDERPLRSLEACWRRELQAGGLSRLPVIQYHELRFLRSPGYMAPVLLGRPHRLGLIKPQTFARIYLSDYLPDVRRVLWLDHDLLIKEDLSPLYRMRMRAPIAAKEEFCSEGVPLCSLASYAKCARCAENLEKMGMHLDMHRHLFNTGVLLMDLDEWRRQKLTTLLETWVNITEGVDGDQAAFNIVFQGVDGIHQLDWHWNMHPATLQIINVRVPAAMIRESKVVHFSGECKPWTRQINLTNADLSCHTTWMPYMQEVYRELKPVKLECPIIDR